MTGDNKKIGGIQGTKSTSKVQGLSSVDAVDTVETVQKVQAANAVEGVGSISGVKPRLLTRVMSAAERAQMFEMIQQEADKMFKDMPPEKRKVVSEAVKIAIESGSIDEE